MVRNSLLERGDKPENGGGGGGGGGERGGGGGGGGGGAGTFPIFQIIFQDLSFLHLEITLLFAKLCYAFEEKP